MQIFCQQSQTEIKERTVNVKMKEKERTFCQFPAF